MDITHYRSDLTHYNFSRSGKSTFTGRKFKYDSEDSDAENKKVEKEKSAEKTDVKKGKGNKYAKQSVWREKFFLLPGDARLAEGMKFFLEKPTSGQVIRDNHKSEDIRTIKAIIKKRVNRKLTKVNAERKKKGLKVKKTKKTSK
jgi:hypothetical protein